MRFEAFFHPAVRSPNSTPASPPFLPRDVSPPLRWLISIGGKIAAQTELVAEMSPLASEPGLRGASESSTKRTTDAASETAHHASLDSRSLYDRIARPFCKQWCQKEIAH